MIKRLLFAFLFSPAFTTFAQINSLGKSDPEAKEILGQVSARFKTYKTVTANFTLKVQNTAGETVANEIGSLQMKDDKYRIITPAQQIFSDGKTIWTYDIADKEVQLTTYDPASDVITPQKMFTDFYDSEFLYKLNEERKVNGKMLQQIELTPKDKTKVFFKLLVEVDKATRNIVSTTMFEKNGNRYIYTITSLRTNIPLEDGLFVFDAKSHKNVEVVDLR